MKGKGVKRATSENAGSVGVMYLLTFSFVFTHLPIQIILCSWAEHSVEWEIATPLLLMDYSSCKDCQF